MDSLLNSEKLAYDRDYELMIKEFKIEDARNKHVAESKNKLKNLNRKWKKSLERMKNSKELELSFEREKVMSKIEERKNVSFKQIRKVKEKKMQFLTELQSKTKDANQALKDKINNKMEDLEHERLFLQETVLERMQKISRKNKGNLEDIRKNFEGKFAQSLNKFNKNYSNVLLLNDEKLKNNIEKPILKFEKWVLYK